MALPRRSEDLFRPIALFNDQSSLAKGTTRQESGALLRARVTRLQGIVHETRRANRIISDGEGSIEIHGKNMNLRLWTAESGNSCAPFFDQGGDFPIS